MQMFWFAVVALIVYLVVRWLSSPKRAIPGPLALPIIGSVASMTGFPSLTLALTRELEKFQTKILEFFIFSTRVVAVCDTDQITNIFADPKTFNTSKFVQHMWKHIVSNSLIANEGERWKVHRRILTAAFHGKSLRAQVPMMDKCARDFMRTQFAPSSEEVEITEGIRTLTLQMMGLSVLSCDLFSNGPEDTELLRLIRDSLVGMEAMALTPPFLRSLPFPSLIKLRRVINRLRGILHEHVNTRRMRSSEPDYVEPDDFMSCLMREAEKDSDKFSDAEIIDNLLLLLLTGYETGATALCHAFGLLARRPDVQERISAELDSVVGDGDITDDHLKRLPYLEQVFRETMRLAGVASHTFRYVTKPVNVGGYDIPAGTEICINADPAHSDPGYWGADHKEFNPDRMEDARFNSLPKNAWMPFGGGHHQCPGRQYARSEILMILAHFFRMFRCETKQQEKYEIIYGFFNRPGPIRISVLPRDQTVLPTIAEESEAIAGAA